MITYLKEESFDELTKEGNVIVDFYADWCGPCQSLAVELESMVEGNNDIKVIKVDVDVHEDLARDNKIMSIPAIFLYKNGEVAKKHVGYISKEDLLDWLK